MTKKNPIGNMRRTLPLILIAALGLTSCSSNDDDAGQADTTMSTAGDTTAGADTVGDSTAGTDTDGDTTAGTTTDGDTTAGTDAETDTFAYAAVAAFPSGQIERISFSDGFTIDSTYPAALSDIRAETDGKALYQLGRFQIDSLTKYSATDTSVVDYQFSLNGEEISSNPHDVVFVSETKAYVLRYGSPTIWVINPSATIESEFKIGEMDISAYDPDTTDEDLSPNATSGVIVDGKLFVLMQRLSVSSPIEQGYVAVFDVETNTEIDTGKGEADNLKGIPLDTLNPTNIRYNSTTEEIYVTGRGNIYVEYNLLPGDPYQGGLFAIDDTTYDVSQLLDDGDGTTNNDQGFIERTLVVNDEKGYVSMYANIAPTDGTSRSILHTFSPMTGIIGEALGAINGDIATLNIGSDGHLWVGVNNPDTPGFARLNVADDTSVEPFIATSFSPVNVVFIDVPKAQ